jgi:DNA ligase N terminus
MQAFTQLYDAIDSTTGTNAKVKAMVEYFRQATPADAAWALYFLTGRRLKRFISSKRSRTCPIGFSKRATTPWVTLLKSAPSFSTRR